MKHPERTHSRGRRWGRAAIVIGALSLPSWGCAPDSTVREFESRLGAAVGGERLIRPRLVGGFPHGACPRVPDSALVGSFVCAPTPHASEARRAVEALSASVLELTRRAPGPAAARLQGQWTLLTAVTPADFERAVAELERAAEVAPTDARTWSDLSAARLALAGTLDEPRGLMAAAAAADRALELDPSLSPARFNRALALDEIGFLRPAIEAWEDVLGSDPENGWSREARVSLERLRRPRAAWDRVRDRLLDGLGHDEGSARALRMSYPSEAERHAVEVVLTAWATALLAGDAERSGEARDLAWAIADALEGEDEGSTLVGQALRAIDSAEGTRLTQLVGAIADLRLGIVRPEDAVTHLERAVFTLDALDSPLSIVARDRLATSTWASFRWGDLEQLGDDMLETASRHGHPRWMAVAWRWRALAAGAGSRYSDAREATRQTLAHAAATDHALRARSYSDAADLAVQLGGSAEAWAPSVRALRALRLVDDLRAEGSVFRRFARLLVSEGYPTTGLAALDEVVGNARADGGARDIVGALLQRAELRAATGRYEGARRDAEEARRLIATYPSAEDRIADEQNVRLVEGDIAVRSDPQRALGTLPALASEFRQEEYYYPLARVYVLLAEAHMSLGEPDSAVAMLQSALSEIESQRAALTPELRADFQDRARPLFEDLVALHMEEDSPHEAFDLLERMRSRSLLEGVGSTSGRGGGPRTAEELRSALPDGTAVVSYAVLADRAYAWVLTSLGLESARLDVRPDDLRETTETFRSALRTADSPRVDELGAELFEDLVRPVQQYVEGSARLVLVPDRALHHVPFAALFDASRGSFLVEDHTLLVAPSASFHAAASAQAATLRPEAHEVLAVGNPAFPRSRYLQPDLPHAEAEAQAVFEIWEGSAVRLVGPAATRQAFLTRAADATIVHFAGHALVNPGSSSDSYLLFAAGDDDDSAELRTSALPEDAFSRTALMILSACQTAEGRLSETEGVVSLARGFLEAGVPSLVASLWDVPDEPTASFFIEFHRRLAAGQGAADALRETQVAAARGVLGPPIPAATWAAFQLIGGG